MKNSSNKSMYCKPRHAVILAAGAGTRLRPLTYCVPKPLMPVWGIPSLYLAIDNLHKLGVTEILINLHHAADAVAAGIMQRRHPARIALSFEPEVLGTGGALQHAAWFLSGRGPFWMVNADVVWQTDARPLSAALYNAAPQALAALWLESSRGPCTVMHRDGIVRQFHGGRPGMPESATFTGLQLISPDILKWIPPNGPSSIISAYELAQQHGRSIAAVMLKKSFWGDIGNLEDYIDVHERIRHAAAENKPGAGLYNRGAAAHKAGAGAWIALSPGAKVKRSMLERCILLPEATAKNCRAIDAVITPGVDLRATAEGAVVPLSKYPPEGCIKWAMGKCGWDAAGVYINPLAARGSDRSYLRLIRGSDSFILCRYGNQRAENRRMASHSRCLLQFGVPVPPVLHYSARNRCFIAYDAGIVTLLKIAQTAGRTTLFNAYKKTLRALLSLHSVPPAAVPGGLEPPFNAALYLWEHNLFIDCFIKQYCGQYAGPEDLRRELVTLAQPLLHAPPALVHRDMQSSNVLWHNNQPVFIDFQGMRRGAAAYDLASLLYDPYVMLDEALQESLLDEYTAISGRTGLREEFRLAAVQRLIQALGAFGRLSALPDTKRFARHIPGALHMLQRAIGKCPAALPELSRAVQYFTVQP